MWRRNIRSAIESILSRFPQCCVILPHRFATFASQNLLHRNLNDAVMCLLPAGARSETNETLEEKWESVMSRSKAERFRAMAAECARQAELASEEPEFRELQKRLGGAYAALAESEDWLDGRADTEAYLVPGIPAGETAAA